MTTVRLRYFALLRDQAGRSEEQRATAAPTADALYTELAALYAFTLPAERIRVAVNGDFVPLTRALRDGDEVVFIPPVSGG